MILYIETNIERILIFIYEYFNFIIVYDVQICIKIKNIKIYCTIYP